MTNSEDEDVAELRENEVFSTRTRGKRNVIPRKMLVDDSDEDFFDGEEEFNRKKEAVVAVTK